MVLMPSSSQPGASVVPSEVMLEMPSSSQPCVRVKAA